MANKSFTSSLFNRHFTVQNDDDTYHTVTPNGFHYCKKASDAAIDNDDATF